MSSDGYFDDDDEFDNAALAELNAIEAAHFSSNKQGSRTAIGRPASPIVPSSSKTVSQEISFDDISFDFDEVDLAPLDTFIADAYQGKTEPVAGPSKLSRTPSSTKVQTTLFGDVLHSVASTSTNKAKQPLERTKSTSRNPFGKQAQKTKQWDHTQFAKTGIRKAKSSKGKGKMGDDEEEEVEFEQFPAPFVPIGPPPPMKLSADLLEAKHWIYPLNRPKRDYQFNIVKKSLFDNTLVALPTGLGKTFIAGVVMLNYYRWFPEGKVVFVAPAKPLVAQQISACHETCGIPGSDSIELNGEVPTTVRERHWKEKRVFFMTPQTFMNDLQSERCDARSIVLYVVDEAHRATGDYSYNQVIRFLMAKNPHFRVLALTATPGNKPEAVQALIDSLHISHIEIRNEDSLDLRPYIHKKIYKPHVIAPDDNLGKLRDLLAKTMESIMKPLRASGVLHGGDNAIKMHPYRAQSLMASAPNKQFYSPLSMLSKLARAMMYLLAGSYGMCYTYCHEMMNDKVDEDAQGTKKKFGGKKLRDDPNFCAFMAEFERQHAQGFSAHPKVEMLKTILIQHFGSRVPDEGEDDTRVMVFSSFRGVVDEIVEELNKDRPLIRASRFIGQGADKQGNKGQAQKEQLEVINKFKAGVFNVLVATSIGEEGLDIGELDMTVCYDADKAPTRMIQRFGRTGRKREGTIHALLAEGREEGNIDKAEFAYKEVQGLVNKGEDYELYGDVGRLLPDHIIPQCVEKVVEIERYVREEGRRKASAKDGPQGKKRKRNDDVERNIPVGASSGFVSVRDLVVKKSKKKKKAVLPKNFDDIGEDDETDEDIESGRVAAPARRTQSAAARSTEKKMPKSKLKKSATIPTNKAPKKSKKKTKEYTAIQFSQLTADDSDDLDIEAGVILPSLRNQIAASKSLKAAMSPKPSPEPSPKLLKKQIDPSVIELSDSELGHLSSPDPEDTHDSPMLDTPDFGDIPINGSPPRDQNMSWLVDDDDDENRLDFEIVDSSPLVPKRSPSSAFERVQIGDESMEISNPVPYDDEIIPTSDPLEPALEISLEFVELQRTNRKNRLQPQHIPFSSFRPASILLSPSRKSNAAGGSHPRFVGSSKFHSSPTCDRSSSPAHHVRHNGKTTMLPPAIPRRLLESPGDSSAMEIPDLSFPIRPVILKRRRIIYDEPESPSEAVDAECEIPPPSQRHLHRMESTPAREKRNKKKQSREKPSLLAHNVNPLFDGEAEHSGDEVSEGCSEEDEESESDRQFIKDSPATQMSQSYDQSLIYRQSLLTQAPGPSFDGRAPVRSRPFGRINGPRRRYQPSSSPPPDDDLDHYHLGTFVVDDDEEISYEL
ncbi:P-loop containing nucleoside triphosphate hydrolase protein [Pholiota conissans]|uniref:ATP-dependent DNA helicase n=1 Tax=Pholiota conissans TaxID=109636 RepID=A0A9P5Z5L2_9AGAR|nr:P-loop containing nucleoside triphosphate hydrolase protein [Pholiota conissans]